MASGYRWVLLAGLLLSSTAWSQGWPALETADFVAVGGGQHDAAVLIGIDDYYQLPDVVGAEANVAAWERWLRWGRKVPASNIRLLRGQVGKAQVRTAVVDAAAKVGPKGTLYFVFVGHGGPGKTADGQEAHLLMADTLSAAESFADRGVAVYSELATWLSPASAKGAKVVAVLDACFTGKAQGGGDLVPGAQFAALSSLATPAALTVLSAASSDGITGLLPGASRPAFSYLVLAALRGWGDGNGDGEVSAMEAVDFALGVMRDAQRSETPGLNGLDLALGKSGGEAAPDYRGWLGQALPLVSPSARTAPVVSAPQLGAEVDIATLAAQAEQTEAAARLAQAAAVRAQAAAATLLEAKIAQNERLVAEAQLALKPQVARDFAAIARWVASPSETARPALEAFVAKYGAASVSIDGQRYALSVPEVAGVRQALAAKAGASGEASSAAAMRAGIDERTGIEWVRIEGGTFSMGSDDGKDDERPRWQVTMPSFWLAKTEVTVAQYRRCVEARACAAPDKCNNGMPNWGQPDRDEHPLNCVSWTDAQSFAKWVGGGARLPSEAEWEFAARSRGREQKYPWGDAEATCRLAMMADGTGKGCGAGLVTAPVCNTPAGNSAQGVCDLAGNLWEWVEDGLQPYTQAPSDGRARVSATEHRVFRGGGWDSDSSLLRAALRFGYPLGYRANFMGFRLAR